MLFTATTPAFQGDRIVLYFDAEQARDAAPDGHTIFEVAASLDASRRRLTTTEASGGPDRDPSWATPAYLEDFHRIVARGPLPSTLFVARSAPASPC